MPLISGFASSASIVGDAGTPNSCWNARRFSSERLKPATILTCSDLAAARVSTLAQRPSPMMPTCTGCALMESPLATKLRLRNDQYHSTVLRYDGAVKFDSAAGRPPPHPE